MLCMIYVSMARKSLIKSRRKTIRLPNGNCWNGKLEIGLNLFNKNVPFTIMEVDHSVRKLNAT